MLKIIGNDITRGGKKIGYVTENDVYDEHGRKVGYFTSNDVYDASGHKRGYLEGDSIHLTEGKTIRISENHKDVEGGSLSDLARAAVRLLLGD